MVIVEKSFPRGGAGQKETKPDEGKEHIVFGALQKKIRKTKTKTKDENDLFGTAKEDGMETNSAELLNYSTIQDGMNLMGMVKAVDQLYISISLPGRMIAKVSALEISDAYTKSTSNFLERSEQAENYKPLTELYSVGQIVYGKVMELKQHGQRTVINLTLKPSEVHFDLIHTNVKKGFIFNGAIEEVQEHGFIIESGIKGLRCFLPLEKADPASTYAEGELIFMRVEKITHDKAASTCICKAITAKNLKIKNQIDPILDYILPSTIVNFNVTKILKDGLQGTIMNEAFTAYINEHQLTEPLALPEDFTVKKTLSARVLYVMPLTKFVYLTLNIQTAAGIVEQMDEANQEPQKSAFQRGDIVENARVHHLGTGGVVLVLNNKFKGIISYKTIKANYKGNYDQDELLIKYAKKTQHKVRILDYNMMDSLYMCTDDAKILEEKAFSLSDLHAGEFVTAIVREREVKVGGYAVQVGKIRGIIENLFLAPTTQHLENKTQVRCRILSVNTERNIVYLTNRPEYMSKTCKILSSLQEAKVNAVYVGTIVKCNEDYFLVKFFNNVKGVLHKQRITGFMANELSTFYEGQSIQFRIASRKEEQIILSLPDDVFKLGELCPISITHKLDSGLEIKILHDDDEEEIETKGFIPLRLLSDFDDLLYAKLHMFKNEEHTLAACMVKNVFSLRDVNYFKNNLTKDWRTVQSGDILRAYVKNVERDVVHIMLPIRGYDKLVKVHVNMMLINTFKEPNIVLNQEQIVFVKVLSKGEATKTLTISAKLTDVWDGEMKSTSNYIQRYLQEVRDIKKAYKKQGKSIALLTIGDKVTATFQGLNAETQDWQFELQKTKIFGIVKSLIVGKSQPPKVGEAQECCVLWVDYSNQLVFLTNKFSDIERIVTAKKISPNLVGKSGLNAKILLKLENVFICSLKKGKNPLIFCPMRLHYNDFENAAATNTKEGDFCKLTFIDDDKPIAVLDGTSKLWHDIRRKRKIAEEEHAVKIKKAKMQKEERELSVKKQKLETKLAEEVARKLKAKEDAIIFANKQRLKMLPGKVKIVNEQQKIELKEVKLPVKKQKIEPLFYEDKIPSAYFASNNIAEKTFSGMQSKEREATTMPGITDFWSTDLTQLQQTNAAESSDEDEANAGQDVKRKKKLTTAEKFKQQRDEEARLREIEEKYADPKQLPESVDQFDRLVLSEPNNSKHWINYMVFHLQSTEIDKARAVARRAIKAISFRSVDEQLNIWIALLNLELRYGTKSSFDETFKEALTYNEPQKIYFRTIEILSDAKKQEELIEMIGVVTRKFKQIQETWRIAANAYFVIDMSERAQKLLHKALACLPERDHVNTIVMFANLNHKHGNNEMAQTLLDQVVTSYPKRVDVWTQYVDLLIKTNLIDSARAVLERAVIQKIPLKKMRTIFKKYLEFEERFGNEADVQKVKKLAADFVKNNANQ